ncbi:MAG TPA: ATP-binding cassette domain-containing protein [Arthrobacter sp.]|nr:ATP-binding cassette domain-containing protein [Arthrobacter sp.]
MSLKCVDVDFRYRRSPRWVFRGLSWEIPSGRRTVLLGPNGAGKSTLLRVLAGIEKPRNGEVVIDGKEVRARTRRRADIPQVAWMPQEMTAIRGLTVVEQVAYAAWLSGMPERMARVRAAVAVEQVHLDDKATHRARTLSGGQLRRLGLAEALVVDADYLLLDEPTAGLDPAQRQNFRDILSGLSLPGLVVSTHQTDDIAELFDHVTVLADGAIPFDGSVGEFRALAASTDGPGRASTEERAFASLVGGGAH